MILLYLQTEAVRTGNPEIVPGRSMNAWLTKVALSAGGRTRELVAEQARRISATFYRGRRQKVLGTASPSE